MVSDTYIIVAGHIALSRDIYHTYGTYITVMLGKVTANYLSK